MKLRDNPLFHIIHISKMIEQVMESQMQGQCSMSHADAKMIFLVGHTPGITQTELAGMLMISSPAVSRHVDKLEKDGLLKRSVHPESRRSYMISLTKKGTSIHKKTTQYLESTLESILKKGGGIDKQSTKKITKFSLTLEEHVGRASRDLRESITED